LDTRLELIKFYDSHYSANLMQLVVYGKGFPSNFSAFPYKLSAAKTFFFGYFPSQFSYLLYLQRVSIACRTLLKISSAILEMLGGSHSHFLGIHVHVNISRFTI
jgi:hypothetical protein